MFETFDDEFLSQKEEREAFWTDGFWQRKRDRREWDVETCMDHYEKNLNTVEWRNLWNLIALFSAVSPNESMEKRLPEEN